MVSKPLVAVASLATLVSAGCSPGATGLGGSPGTAGISTPADRMHGLLPQTKRGTGPSGYISNVIVIIQENRSFENLFAGYPYANAPMFGCVNRRVHAKLLPLPTKQLSSGSDCPAGDVKVALTQTTFQENFDIRHDWNSSMTEWHKGKMDGFGAYGKKHGKYVAYQYVDRSQVKPYWDMASQYVLSDAMFPTEFGGSFTGHLTLVAGTDDLIPTKAEVDFPNGIYDDCDSPPGTRSSYLDPKRKVHRFKGPFPCFTQWNTIANPLDSAGVPWKYYASKVLDAGFWEPFEAMSYVRYGPDWSNIVAPQQQFLTDAADGNLASVNWVTPSKEDSDHPKYLSDTGPSWVASLVNAVGESSYWNTSAIIVVWDDWGGFYDNAPPPQPDYRGLGIRVPCLIISPYAKQGYVSHVQLEFASVLKFIEEVYGLDSIGPGSQGYSDQRANDLQDAFDFSQSPRPFVPFASKYKKEHFLREPPSNEPVDTE
jgi:phospholipase C